MGGNTLDELKRAAGIRSRYFRNLVRLVDSEKFEDYFEVLEEKERLLLKTDLMQSWAIERVKKKINELQGEKTFSDLRSEASSLRIVGYSRMTKGQLEKAIERKRNG